MSDTNQLIQKTTSTALKAVLLTTVMVGIGLVVSLISWLSLLPKLSVCGENLLSCGIVVLAIGFLAVVCPLIMFWCGRGYVFFKILYELYKVHETPVLKMCAEQICKHREIIVTAGELKNHQLSKKLPLPVRLLLRKINLDDFLPLLKQTPPVTPPELMVPLKDKVAAQGIIQKPSVIWFWALLAVMFVVRLLVGWFV